MPGNLLPPSGALPTSHPWPVLTGLHSPCTITLASLPPAWTTAGWLKYSTICQAPSLLGLPAGHHTASLSSQHQLQPSGSCPEGLHELHSWFLSSPENYVAQGNRTGQRHEQVRRGGRATGRRVETARAGHAWPRGEATQHWHPALPSSQAFLGSSRAERSRGQHVSSARQGGRRSLTAAGKGLALAVSEKEAAKVTDTELSGFSSFSPGPSARQGGRHCSPAAAHGTGYHLPSRSSQPFLGPKAYAQGLQ